MEAEKFEFFTIFYKHPFKTEINQVLKSYVEENKIMYIKYFDYDFADNFPNGYRYFFRLTAVKKITDDKLRECIEFQISNL